MYHSFLQGGGQKGGLEMVGLGRFWSQKILLALALGQLVSHLITASGFSTSELSRRALYQCTNLAILFHVFTLSHGIWRSGSLLEGALQMKWYFYLFLAIVDVEGNFLVVKADQYTSITSVMLLNCWTIPSVIFLTWMFLKTQYRFRKFVGVGICVAGLVMVIFSDVPASDLRERQNLIKGDLLAIGGSMLCAVSSVSKEFLVKAADRIELMAMPGAFGAISSARQIGILERAALASIHWASSVVLPLTGYVVATSLFYSFVPVLLKNSGSTMLNLSQLTSDMWAILIRLFVYHQKVDWLYFIAFGAVVVGLVIYLLGLTKQNPHFNKGEKDQGSESAAQVSADTVIDHHDRDEEAVLGNMIERSAAGMQRVGDGKTETLAASHK